MNHIAPSTKPAAGGRGGKSAKGADDYRCVDGWIWSFISAASKRKCLLVRGLQLRGGGHGCGHCLSDAKDERLVFLRSVARRFARLSDSRPSLNRWLGRAVNG